MTITPEQALEYLKDWAVNARRLQQQLLEDKRPEDASICATGGDAIEWAIARIEELEARSVKAVDLIEDLIGLSEAAMLRANFDGGEYQIDAELEEAREFVKQLTGGRKGMSDVVGVKLAEEIVIKRCQLFGRVWRSYYDFTDSIHEARTIERLRELERILDARDQATESKAMVTTEGGRGDE